MEVILFMQYLFQNFRNFSRALIFVNQVFPEDSQAQNLAALQNLVFKKIFFACSIFIMYFLFTI